MIVATSVATDARVLKEAATLVGAGHTVHIIGKNVPSDFTPDEGVTVSSVGASSVLRREGAASLATRTLSPPVRLARWLMLPTHRNSAFRRFGQGAERIALSDNGGQDFDVVHAHDFTSLEAGARIAAARAVPLVYDTHEFWGGRSREYRPTPLQDRRERRVEARLGAQAAAVITVGDGVAGALRQRYRSADWPPITVVRNSFPPLPADVEAALPPLPDAPTELIYAGRVGAHRELETAAAASADLAEAGVRVVLMGPVDTTWLAQFNQSAAELRAPTSPDEVDAHLRRAGLVLVALAPGWENHRLALPNKLFHAARAGVPVVASDIGELASVVREYGLGTLYAPGDSASLTKAVSEAVCRYGDLKNSVAAAQRQLSWAEDGAALLRVYDSLARAAPPAAANTAETSITARIAHLVASVRDVMRAEFRKVGGR